MNISNLNELLNTKIINEGSISSVLGFALDIEDINAGFAFFTNDKEEAKLAVDKGAFCIISSSKLEAVDKEVFYLQSDDLELALLRLLRFLSEEKELNFILCDRLELCFAEAFAFKSLKGNVFQDFKLLTKAKNKSYFFCDKQSYLLKLCANYKTLKNASFELLNDSSLFFTSILCEGEYFKNLKFPYIYAKFFANFVHFFKQEQLSYNFSDKKLDFLKIFFVDTHNQICAFGTSTRAFLLAKDELHFDFIQEHFKQINGFKTALKNSLFCDFSYQNLEKLINYKDFKYCLILENEDDFLSAILSQPKEKTLF
ncbi:hypothetical protein DMB92_01785 [Campylobacter sp. MIT 99-7217]|uniref:hypothetical protein n=1 Tax=Campylobacter sp. MIT 99-7217 TaxID=535091 RepID=UPI001158477D|nr:hypothetical protein [Campylobacter sp. MIT 99-7217]TQR34715.1 hypothetical protein DMB92_01785 [Campylobacter sp. MIT 99-7217]